MDDGQDYMDDAGGQGDVCEFVNRIMQSRAYMRRLLDIIRDSQQVCTDSECLESIARPARMPSEPDGSENWFGDGYEHAPLLVLSSIILITLFIMSLASDKEPTLQTKRDSRDDRNNPDGDSRGWRPWRDRDNDGNLFA